MKLLIFIVVAFLFVPILADAVLVGKNIIKNGDFENRPGGKDEDPRGWGSWNSEDNGLSTTTSRSGSQGAYLACPKTGDSNGIFFTYTKVEPGKEYTFSCYVKNSSKEPLKGDVLGQLSIEWFKKGKDKDGKDTLVEINHAWGPKFGPELPVIKWVPVTMTATAPANVDTCHFTIQFFNKGNGSGEFFADQASAEEVDQYFKAKSKDIKAVDKSATASNLLSNLSNPDFETGDLNGWSTWSVETNSSVVNSPTHSGTYALREVLNNGSSEGGYFQNLITLGISPGDLINGNVWIKAEFLTNEEAYLRIEFMDDNWAQTGPPLESNHITGTSDWTKVSVSGTIPTGTTKAHYILKLSSTGTVSGDVYFDGAYCR